MTGKVDALGQAASYSYDGLGRRVGVTDELGRVTQTTYDRVGSTTALRRPDGTTTAYTYNDVDRVITMTAADGGITTSAYDADNNLTSLTDANGHTRLFSYDAMNRRASATDASGGIRRMTYDVAGNLTAQQIRDARKVTLTSLLEKRGHKLVETGGGNFLVTAFPGLIVKDSYWRWPERDQSGNAIDFLVQVLGLSFHDAMRDLTGS